MDDCDKQIDAYNNNYWFTIWMVETGFWIMLTAMGSWLMGNINGIMAGAHVGFFVAVGQLFQNMLAFFAALNPWILGIIGVIILAIIIIIAACFIRYYNYYKPGLAIWTDYKSQVLDSGLNFLSYGKDTMTISHHRDIPTSTKDVVKEVKPLNETKTLQKINGMNFHTGTSNIV